MPGDVLLHGSMAWDKVGYKIGTSTPRTTCENCLSVDDLVLLGGGVDVQQADGVVIRGGQQVPDQVGVQ